MFLRLSESSRQALFWAIARCSLSGASSVTLSHLLSGVLMVYPKQSVPESIAEMRRELRGTDSRLLVGGKEVSYGPETLELLNAAAAIADQRGQHWVRPPHLLLCLEAAFRETDEFPKDPQFTRDALVESAGDHDVNDAAQLT